MMKRSMDGLIRVFRSGSPTIWRIFVFGGLNGDVRIDLYDLLVQAQSLADFFNGVHNIVDVAVKTGAAGTTIAQVQEFKAHRVSRCAACGSGRMAL